MRRRFVCDLTKDLLGPRHGVEEIFPPVDEPKNEYLIGQLHPPTAQFQRAPEHEEATGGDTTIGEEDDEDPIIDSVVADAGRNFRRVPSSFGISFILNENPGPGELRICATWARYLQIEGGGWRRVPSYFIETFDPTKLESEDANHEIFLSIKISPLKDGRTKVTVYMGSKVRPHKEGTVNSSEIIFQPELRIRLERPEQLVELGDPSFTSEDPEWRISTRQYARLAVMARGHLCGAYWSDIDPQRAFTPEPGADVPFVWLDGTHFLPREKRLLEFFEPHLRTDFLPQYSAPAPSFDWDEKWQPMPELSARRFSECAEGPRLKNMLQPLTTHYRVWIESKRSLITGQGSVAETEREICRRHEEALRRIVDGIEFLASNENALSAFAFMNKAMDLQSGWSKANTEEMRWRPFQLAFILMALRSTVENTPEREICDIIWFPTGGGKTEAYLGLAAFAAAYRRLTSVPDAEGHRGGEGTTIISRYTLRLLTIQQFRRASRMITACELLRVGRSGAFYGWRPSGKFDRQNWIWGRSPFSIGLWVGGRVTPNAMEGRGWGDTPSGALYLLAGYATEGESDPAQIIHCPCCKTILSVPVEGLPPGQHKLHFYVMGNPNVGPKTHEALSTGSIRVESVTASKHLSGRTSYLSLQLALDGKLTPSAMKRWWEDVVERILGTPTASFNATRPGYIKIQGGQRGRVTDYEIRCPKPDCDLNKATYRYKTPAPSNRWDWTKVHPLFADPQDETQSHGVPIHAVTVDEKLYGFPPTMLVSTCDKIANTSWTEDAASLFGRVRSYNPKSGFTQISGEGTRSTFRVHELAPPLLVIQDELHLLDGPLGSMFGLYEAIVDYLCSKPKYIASSATIRNASEQVRAIMAREARVFPPVSIDVTDGFFLRVEEAHPLDEGTSERRKPGRLFLGLAFPGRAMQTPMLRIWGRLLQTAQDLLVEGADQAELDYFWTLVGYFNAVRELAIGASLWRQDIPQYLDKLINRGESRERRPMSRIEGEGFHNLSSQTPSSALPGILSSMEHNLQTGHALDAVAATSMFGTGVDVTRLSLMIVHGQPKSASSYIQAVGRIGRERAGLAVVFFRVSKPRDLNHYEYFTGYHRRLPVAVEPITVKPLAPRAIDRVVGPLLVTLMRNARNVGGLGLPNNIETEDGGIYAHHVDEAIWNHVREIFTQRWEWQPETGRPELRVFIDQVLSKVERWKEFSRRRESRSEPLKYNDILAAVLGGAASAAGEFVYTNAPKSLREVEAVVKIYTERD